MAHKRKAVEGPTHSMRLGDRGRMVLPAAVRKRLKLTKGDRLVVTVEPDGSVVLRSLRTQIDKVAGMFRRYVKPGESVVDEFLRERREEAERE